MKKKPIPEKFKTPRCEPNCVRYWDRKFRTMNIWFEWVATKSHIDSIIPEVKQELNVSKPDARIIVWTGFVAAIMHEESPVESIYDDLLVAVEPEEFPLLFCHLMIGADIFEGHSEKQAVEQYKEWMQEGDNAIFGDYRITEDFRVVRI